MAIPTATVQFFGDWWEVLNGSIHRNGHLTIAYDLQRMPHCFTKQHGAELGESTAYVRFHPCGEILSGSVVAPVRDHENPPGMVTGHKPVPFGAEVPDDATQVEIWFHNFSTVSGRCDAWDSRFGDNYWFEVGGIPARIPTEPVRYRGGALTSPEMVNVLERSATKSNVFPWPTGGGPRQGTDLQTTLKVTSWVRETMFGANAWIDIHIYDSKEIVIHRETLTLLYTGLGSSFRYEFSGKVYQGSTATPGSV